MKLSATRRVTVDYEVGKHCCKDMTVALRENAIVLNYDNLAIGETNQTITFCPFCGAKIEKEDC